MLASLSNWSTDTLNSIREQWLSPDDELVIDLLPCGKAVMDDFASALFPPHSSYSEKLPKLVDMAHNHLRAAVHGPTPLCWRRMYSEASLAWSLLDCTVHNSPPPEWKVLIARLDHAIVISGAPGEGRLDLILDTIEQIQRHHLPLLDVDQVNNPECTHSLDLASSLASAALNVPELARPPSLSQFQSSECSSPFVIRGFASDWPAITENRWSSMSYLLRIGGRGRIVPVEVGKDYRADDWTQTWMDWEGFLGCLFSSGLSASVVSSDVVYLAQHDLFKQFPQLMNDIIIPDYVYCALNPPEHFPQYKPPGNVEQLVLNTWLGPKGAYSPAHTDPFFNVYVQVVGYKTIWFAPPSLTETLLPQPHPSALNAERNPAQNQVDPMLSNTSPIDVFSDTSSVFIEEVVPNAMSTVLGPGDLLFFPPGWWHAMRSESTSFSVSMWF